MFDESWNSAMTQIARGERTIEMRKMLVGFARQCFGNFFTRGKWANEVLPTAEIEAAIKCILEWKPEAVKHG